MTADRWMEALRGRVEAHLRLFLDDKREEAHASSPEATELVEAVADLTLRGGKRLRPIVLGAAYEACATEPDERVLADPGAALELLQTYLLIHDDIMDRDDERRGGPSVHARLAAAHGDAHLGTSLAILAGDLAGAYAAELLSLSRFPHGRAHEAWACWLGLQREVYFGQQLDLLASPAVERMYDLKTGAYTTRGPMRLGAILADATPPQLEALERFAKPLGVAFQLRDELLGTFGDPAQTGKPAGNDLRAGKHTVLVAHARATLGDAERAPLERVLGDRGASGEALEEATALLARCGGRALVEERLRALLQEAERALEGAPLRTERLRPLSASLALRSA